MKKFTDIAFVVFIVVAVIFMFIASCKTWTAPCAAAGTCPSWSCYSSSECGSSCFCLKEGRELRGKCARVE